jgi:hypothetical protein
MRRSVTDRAEKAGTIRATALGVERLLPRSAVKVHLVDATFPLVGRVTKAPPQPERQRDPGNGVRLLFVTVI